MENQKSPNFSERQQNPTPKELFERGQTLEVEGNKLAAADLYERSGYTHKAIQIYEAEGNIDKAYELAKRAGDNWTADRLAITQNIPGHEFSDFPPAQGREFDETMRIALKSRLQPGATAEQMGFVGFQDKTVADIGTRDGRFVPLFRDLGAKEVYGIDPDQKELQKAIDKGLLDEKHALPCMLQDLPKEIKGTFEIATVFNFNMPISEQADFFAQLYESLPENGQVVMTVAEDEILQNTMKFIEPYFVMRFQKLWNRSEDYPHKNLVILTKKPPELKK
ncbi:MAG: class I SAM-dependent methyltransferase [Candidatus Parcubacteria bacterium]|nr:class I SAM-dependent methyltransferase [Candidatus Parcubacteria bacterium]